MTTDLATATAHAQALVADLRTVVVERDAEIRSLLLATIAGQHVLLLGPPGTGKSYLTSLYCKALGSSFFEVLMTKYTVPEEVFGPYSLAGLEQDQYRRVTTGYLPDVEVGFLDEALALDTPIPTPTGWTTVGQIAVGDKVLGRNGKPTDVLGLTPIAENHDCYRVTFADGESVVADAGHLWYVRRPFGHSPYRVMTTREIVESGKDWVCPRTAPVDLPDADLPIDPYALGVWLGNGNCWTGAVGVRPEWTDGTIAEFKRAGFSVSSVKPANDRGTLNEISFAGSGFRTALADLGLIVRDGERYTGSNKSVPPIYLRGSINQRRRLLQGLMDTDGYCDSSGTCVFSNTNENIVDAAVEIVRSLGMRCTKKVAKDDRIGANGSHKTCWKVTFRADADASPFLVRPVVIPPNVHLASLRIASVVPVAPVPVRCIRVAADDHLFLAGRSWAVTHNCFKANSSILNSLLTILNEGEFDNGGVRTKVPLKLCVGASNEFPADDSLNALRDRFLLCHWVSPIKNRSAKRALFFGANRKPTATLTKADVDVLRAACDAVQVPDVVQDAMMDLADELEREHGITASDRRWRQATGLVRASAVLDGRDVATPRDLNVLAHVLWRTLEERATIGSVVAKFISPKLGEAMKLYDAAVEMVGKIDHKAVGQQATAAIGNANAELAKIEKSIRGLSGTDPEIADYALKVARMRQEVGREVAKRLGLDL